MSGRVYYLPFDNETYTAAGTDFDLWEVAPADDRPFYLARINLEKLTDLGDAELEGISLEVIVGHATTGSGGSSYTGSAVGRKNTSAVDPGFTEARMNTTIAATGTTYTVLMRGWPYPMFEHVWTPDERPLITQADTRVCVRALTTVADDVSISGTLTVVELG